MILWKRSEWNKECDNCDYFCFDYLGGGGGGGGRRVILWGKKANGIKNVTIVIVWKRGEWNKERDNCVNLEKSRAEQRL